MSDDKSLNLVETKKENAETLPSKTNVTAEKSFGIKHNESIDNPYDPHPAWNPPHEVPITRCEVEAIFLQLTDVFGFQYDNTKNMFDYLFRLLDSRASRMGPVHALRSLHADYIGGLNSNFRKWYFAAQLDIDDSVGFHRSLKRDFKISKVRQLDQNETQWSNNMNTLSPTDCVIQISLYLLCWGEANNIRFMPECLCFIFKCCNDYYYALDTEKPIPSSSCNFLDHVITPLYQFYRDQSYKRCEGDYYHTDKDHEDTIGYDDMNQLFWHRRGLERLTVQDGKVQFMSLTPKQRYLLLHEIDWSKAFYKTFRERRNWSHVFVNFSRIWIIHITVFWYFTVFNASSMYINNDGAQMPLKAIQFRLAFMSLAGVFAILMCIVSIFIELYLVPRRWPGARPVTKRLLYLTLALIANVYPTIHLWRDFSTGLTSNLGLVIAVSQFVLSVIMVVYLSVAPLGALFTNVSQSKDRNLLLMKYFVGSFHSLRGSGRLSSYGLWIAIFTSKFTESYFFLTLSLRDPIIVLSNIKMNGCDSLSWLGSWVCSHHSKILLGLICSTDLVLFFLDTYLWYIIWNTMFSVCRSFYIGVSIWTPWRNIFSRLPKRIFSKLIASPNERNIKAKLLVSQIWNSIVISMYREHLLSLEHVQKLIYKRISLSSDGRSFLKEPTFFISQEDQSMKSSLFDERSEAQRRITFFAQSLSTPMPEVGALHTMPSFTVLIPHFNEKIILSLKEIIREEEKYSDLTMLEYLKRLHPLEWHCFVKDTKMLMEGYDNTLSRFDLKSGLDDLSYYSVGFKIATPEYILRTRIWASLRSQTLYRTISGFMNYSRAIKLLFDVENPDNDNFENDESKLNLASAMALRKFRMVVSMQRFRQFTTEEKENEEFLLRAYPELQLCYLDEEVDPQSGSQAFYSVLIDGSCPIMENGERVPKYKIKLSGNPILGDGKSDNQNNALIFTRGEYIQLVDANQDNYLEECLKIRNVLAEFEEMVVPLNPYSVDLKGTDYAHPVSIIGTREYIFSENIGILGDIAAGKEQTFGTLFARTMAHIGGKLHYGHPDFLNSVFMTTRGGVSKAQKGLNLNEDIYAGMNALQRGGRIKHCEYIQCGKGRDLGFESILNFTTKIGAGMGEQMLSREYFYLSSELPLDRFLSFYYAHPGFHLNNVFIVLSIKLFLLVGINLAALTKTSVMCDYPTPDANAPQHPVGCQNLMPVVKWLKRCIFSIFIVFGISFLPLWVQELSERGLYKGIIRLGKHFASFSPLFEIFVCRTYAQSLVTDFALGGARYISTGRGFATARVSFATLYSRFANECLYFGIISALLIIYCSINMWILPLIYFWFTIFGFLICPWLFNPHQFSWREFFLDYGFFLKWLSRGNSEPCNFSWINFTRLARSRIVGVKQKGAADSGSIKVINDIKISRLKFISDLFFTKLLSIVLIGTAYFFSISHVNGSSPEKPLNVMIMLLVITLLPIIVDMLILVLFCVLSLLLGSIIKFSFNSFSSVIANTVHILAVLNHLIFFELLWLLHRWDFSTMVLGLALSLLILGCILDTFIGMFVSKEFRHDHSNRAWWSGKWAADFHGWDVINQPIREFICKTSELSYFARDVVVGHLILFLQLPIIIVPYANQLHSLMLFWLRPSELTRFHVVPKLQQRSKRLRVLLYATIFLLAFIFFMSLLVLPIVFVKVYHVDFEDYVPTTIRDLI
ncbi:uncharacterized protein PRCAT00003694001 [Priceomyces carsonii]|uniref:uncharacterized protein n=1 Tax=Priceomyces carsonii TaxID=28549 RepID=UPI002ED82FD4|nr:unnamed protein product [Priceomyces carsonii]